MKKKIIQEFKARIGNVEYNNGEIDKYYSVVMILNALPELERMVDNTPEEVQTEFIRTLGETCEEVASLSPTRDIYGVANDIANEFGDGQDFGSYSENTSMKNINLAEKFKELNRIFKEKIEKD